ncbi:23S rRNA (uracil(1939)-C(5))-methyltransferase RlmD [bacterium SCSIO 12741]|nr:23S rRNA (uracil(1939)-C(5))-methyltransferase RlmD [bacterium SCSIO 12741]
MGRKRNKNQVLEALEIIDAGSEGKAVARWDDRVVFIPYVVPGDVVNARVTRKRKKYLEAVATEIIQYSDKRVDPVCDHFGTCGGCKWQNLGYEDQLKFKEKQVIETLVRLGKLELPEVSPIMGSGETEYYRNKLEFTFSDRKWITQEQINSGDDFGERRGLGFHIPGRYDKILDVDHCHLQADPSNAIRLGLKEFAISQDLSFYNVHEHSGLLRNVMIRSTSTNEWMVLVSFGEDQPENIPLVMNYLKENFPDLTSLLYVINTKMNDTIYDQEIICFDGQEYIEEEMEGLTFKIGPKSFFQTNSKQAYELYKVTRDYAEITENDLVYDLYTGTGTIANFVARQAKKVIGIESVPEAIEDAWINSSVNEIENVDFYAGDMKDLLSKSFIDEHGRPDIVITDPPRAGMHADVVESLLYCAPRRIVYVSCNPATQARDLQLLSEHYEIKAVQPVDMFPHTHHVENVVKLERRNGIDL